MQILLSLLSNKWTWIALVIAILAATTVYYKHRYEAEQIAFLTFQAQVKAVGEAAQAAADKEAQRHKDEIAQQEKINVDKQKSITLKYADFVRSLRTSAGSSGDQMSAPAFNATICSEDGSNKRLSDALERFEEGSARLFGTAESQAEALITLKASWPK